MGKKAKDKHLARFMRQCIESAKQATEWQQAEAEQVIKELKLIDRSSLKMKQVLSHRIEQIFQEHGSIVGSIIMVEYVLPDVDPSFARKI
ncbi:hypothetical protein [Marinomonas gallaica]|uniref:hypothetical protein n=1 Tax=Marinomonas gallaica TaxID=1806667 RepID=UPI003A8E4FEB